MIDLIVATVESRSPEGIAAGISRLIRGGALGAGDRLPTVRDLAAALGVSPATVSSAWQALGRVGLIASRGRAGSFVLEASTAWMPPHFGELAGSHVTARLDLSTGTPDPELLPDLALALGQVPTRADTASYLDMRVLPDLERTLRSSWPFVPQALTILDGALDAISRCLEVVARYGDRVVVEDPGFPAFLDLLDQLGVEAIPVAVDGEGMRPDLLATALDANPAAIIIQPRAQNPTGVSLTAKRARELARVIRSKSHLTDPVVIEDDHSGEITTAPAFSLGEWLPNRTLHVRSFAKSHGPDLRIGALGGPTSIVDRVVSRRMLGPGWTSRMLQTILFQLLTAAPSVTQISEARRVYHARQKALSEALVRHGAEHTPSDGINTWLRVADERAAIVSLAASGIRVAAGSTFYAVPREAEQFVRITVGRVHDDFDQIGALLARAARAD
ncbi:aminotransferase class I/II-fold pyridoxal phosphate-dependent enzyme [Agreia sp. COWG]|uniref:aminotransferase class I/II-fold pyridoxal phosphate-dependent enzyme n=1 Tax=Agreia sp. COWG TaxID=2773266 RepID=UPI001AFA3AEA|nr:aminotransferase class I/II-fold pyridoxal phosphate-dependent enzyme [Agreia sp. COWG]CAD5994704.1 DNA-binding transcriptional regulator, MocR family, contains an aminotransferase domain [Agreia sp. COWG]